MAGHLLNEPCPCWDCRSSEPGMEPWPDEPSPTEPEPPC